MGISGSASRWAAWSSDDFWATLDLIVQLVDLGKSQMPPTNVPISPEVLAVLLNHRDGGERVRAFLTHPSDGGRPFPTVQEGRWLLDSQQAARVIRHFRQRATSAALSERETAVVRLYVAGASVPDVAAQLQLGAESVRTYLRRARAKYSELGVAASTRSELLAAFHVDR